MNPNSQNQIWSRWTTTITVLFSPMHVSPAFEQEMQRACARFYLKLFGSATELKIERKLLANGLSEFIVDCRTEGAPVPDVTYRRLQIKEIATFFGRHLHGYGDVNVRVDVRVEAGDVGDGRPRSQLILVPSIPLNEGV